MVSMVIPMATSMGQMERMDQLAVALIEWALEIEALLSVSCSAGCCLTHLIDGAFAVSMQHEFLYVCDNLS